EIICAYFRAERLARNANPVALVAATQQQPVYNPQPKPNYNPLTSSTRSHATTQSKGKEIARAPSPPLESEHEVVSDEEETQRDKKIAKLMDLISTSFNKIYKPTNNNLITSLKNRNKNVHNTPRTNKRTGVITVKGLGMQQRNLDQQKRSRILPTTRIRDQELEAHYLYMAKIQKGIPAVDEATRLVFDKEPLEKGDSNTTPNSSDTSNNEREVYHDGQKFQEERSLLASLIENINENKKMNKILRASNTALATELKRSGQPIQTMNMLNSKCTTSFAKPHYLKKCQSTKLCLYDIACYKDNLANMLSPETDETIRLAEESRSKLNDSWIIQSSPEIKCVLELQLQLTLVYMTQNLEKFKQALKEEMIEYLRYFNSLKKEVEFLQSQLELQEKQFSNENDRLLKEYFYNDHMNDIVRFFDNIDEYSDMAWENEVVSKSSAVSHKRNTTQSTPITVDAETPQLIVHNTPDLTNPTSQVDAKGNIILADDA
ncbi:hypothetical protein Tco_0860608, partial [Tanacetum coccineum]